MGTPAYPKSELMESENLPNIFHYFVYDQTEDTENDLPVQK